MTGLGSQHSDTNSLLGLLEGLGSQPSHPNSLLAPVRLCYLDIYPSASTTPNLPYSANWKH